MIELLAPAGNMSSLKAAIYSGANAVYLGLGKFNARQKSTGFDLSNIDEAVKLCHFFNVKVYVAFNTAVKNSEVKEAEEIIKACVKSKVDAFIIADLGMISIFRKYNVPLHASTQMGIHNYEGAKLAKDLGFKRIVLARETLFEDIKKIASLGLEVEYFVHGALCVSFSGGCLLSSFLNGDSGNRGRCNQPCRHLYKSSITNKEEYYLSPSDQCFITRLKELKDLGITSLKIEGRLKSVQYVGEVVNQYRKALDGIFEKDSISMLKRAYNRGNFTEGYNYDKTTDLMSKRVQNNCGECIGKIVKITNGAIFINKTGKLSLKDGVKVFYNQKEIGGFGVDNLKEEDGLYIVRTKNTYPLGSYVHVTLDNSLKEKYENVQPKLNAQIKYEIITSNKLKLIASSCESSVEYLGEVVLKAQNRPLEKFDLENKLTQTNDTIFNIEKIEGKLSNDAFLPIAVIKESKREILKLLANKILKDYDDKTHFVHTYKSIELAKYDKITEPLIEVDLIEKFKFDKAKCVLRLNEQMFLKTSLITKNDLNCNNIEKYLLKLPVIARGKDIVLINEYIKNNIESIEAIVADNLYAIEIAREMNIPVVLSFGLNIYNDYIHKIFDVKNVCSSTELTKKEYLKDSIIFEYGQVCLMTLTHCPVQLNTNCSCANCKYNGQFSYTLSNKKFIICRNKISFCYFNLLSSKKINTLKALDSTNFVPYIVISDEKCKNIKDLYDFSANLHISGHFTLQTN